MPKIKYKEIKEDGENIEWKNKSFYETKYYSLFLSAYKFKNLTEEQSHYLLKQLWRNGRVAISILEGTKPLTLENAMAQKTAGDNGELLITPFAVSTWDIYDYPSVVTLINTRGATFIPSKPFVVNKDAVIGYAHSSHISVRSLVLFYVDKIAEVEKTIETNLFVHKLPRLIVCSPADRDRVKDLVTRIEAGEHKLFLDSDDYQAIKNVLDGGMSNYIIDKLYQYKQSLENELLTFLGIDNIGLEKRERLITDEANANNDLINDHSDCFLENLKQMCKNIKEVLGYEIEVEATSSPVVSESQAQEETQKEVNEDEDE